MARRTFTPDEIQELRSLAAQWGKIVARPIGCGSDAASAGSVIERGWAIGALLRGTARQSLPSSGRLIAQINRRTVHDLPLRDLSATRQARSSQRVRLGSAGGIADWAGRESRQRCRTNACSSRVPVHGWGITSVRRGDEGRARAGPGSPFPLAGQEPPRMLSPFRTAAISRGLFPSHSDCHRSSQVDERKGVEIRNPLVGR
jgi:hypothetical protein